MVVRGRRVSCVLSGGGLEGKGGREWGVRESFVEVEEEVG